MSNCDAVFYLKNTAAAKFFRRQGATVEKTPEGGTALSGAFEFEADICVKFKKGNHYKVSDFLLDHVARQI